jgi:hypothetical protein
MFERIVESNETMMHHVRPVARLHLAQRVAHHLRDLEHRRRRPDVPGFIAGARLLLEDVDRVLGDREVARREGHDDAVGIAGEHAHLRKPGDVVHPRVGARIGRENHPGIQ